MLPQSTYIRTTLMAIIVATLTLIIYILNSAYQTAIKRATEAEYILAMQNQALASYETQIKKAQSKLASYKDKINKEFSLLKLDQEACVDREHELINSLAIFKDNLNALEQQIENPG